MITFIPVGGLANRMKGIDSAVALAQDVQTELRIIWYKDQGLNCRFDQLFQPLGIPNIKLKEASFTDFFLYDRPRRKNFWMPRLFQALKFHSCFYEEKTTALLHKNFDFKQWYTHKNAYIASCVYFYPQNNKKRFSIFKPLPALQQRIETITQPFNASTWGIHIRRTDNITSIAESPTDEFIIRMQEQISRDKKSLFYLATDSEEDKQRLKEMFKERLITSGKQAERNSLAGMEDALVELYALSKTAKIIGSAKSSYSETAAQISDIPYEIAQRKR